MPLPGRAWARRDKPYTMLLGRISTAAENEMKNKATGPQQHHCQIRYRRQGNKAGAGSLLTPVPLARSNAEET